MVARSTSQHQLIDDCSATLTEIRHMIDADKSDLYDVLAYIAFALPTITRQERVNSRKAGILSQALSD